MKKSLIFILVLLLLLPSLLGCSSESDTVKLKIALPTWTGYGPLYLAQEKGFFAEQGLDVELVQIEGLAERKQALAGKKLDGMATAQDVQVTLAASDVPVKVVWALDTSNGGDGILVNKEIKSVSDLKGKTVALEMGTTSHFFALTVLEDAGLTNDDIIIKNMTAGAAGAAFVAGKVDAAVTWEPWLSKGEEKGQVLASTKEYPGVIVDSVSFRADVVEKYPEAMKGFVVAMGKAMDYWKKNKEESEKIMAEGLGIKLEEFQTTIPDLKFYNLEENKEFFGSESSPGPIYKTTQQAIDFYSKLNIVEKKPKPEDIIDGSFVNSL